MVGSVTRRIVPKLQWRNLGTILRGIDPTVSATASCFICYESYHEVFRRDQVCVLDHVVSRYLP